MFLNAFLSHESGHDESARLLARLREQGSPMVVPALVLPEVAAAIARGQQDAALARAFATNLARLPGLVPVPLDVGLARLAVEAAAKHRLRGADAVYAAVALRFGSTLVTRDPEQHERLRAALPTGYPEEALAEG